MRRPHVGFAFSFPFFPDQSLASDDRRDTNSDEKRIETRRVTVKELCGKDRIGRKANGLLDQRTGYYAFTICHFRVTIRLIRAAAVLKRRLSGEGMPLLHKPHCCPKRSVRFKSLLEPELALQLNTLGVAGLFKKNEKAFPPMAGSGKDFQIGLSRPRHFPSTLLTRRPKKLSSLILSIERRR